MEKLMPMPKLMPIKEIVGRLVYSCFLLRDLSYSSDRSSKKLNFRMLDMRISKERSMDDFS